GGRCRAHPVPVHAGGDGGAVEQADDRPVQLRGPVRGQVILIEYALGVVVGVRQQAEALAELLHDHGEAQLLADVRAVIDLAFVDVVIAVPPDGDIPIIAFAEDIVHLRLGDEVDGEVGAVFVLRRGDAGEALYAV